MCCGRFYLLTLLPLLALGGCGRVDRLPTAAAPSDANVKASSLKESLRGLSRSHGPANFYPLDIGNRWEYADESSKTIISEGGRAEKHGSWTRKTVLTRTEVINGREYMREEDELDDPSSPTGSPYTSVRWLRQDRSGLYEVSIVLPDSHLSAETQLLAYPLHKGATWVMTELPHTTAEVERMEVLRTPAGSLPAWRIRIRNGGHLPQEESWAWYGRTGYLGARTHLDVGKPDSTGHIEIIEDQSESLTRLSISRGE